MAPNLNLVLLTTKASIVVQLITGLLGAYGLTIQVPEEGRILKGILTLEMIVQVIEFFFYIILVYLAHIQTMTTLRYGDWLLSTPTMLFTMATYFLYSSESPPNSIEDVWSVHKREIIAICVANFGMLAFGLAGEFGLLSKWSAFTLGTLCFVVSFGLLFKHFAKDSRARPLFYFMTFIWSLYGVAFLQNPHTKNIAYNGPDILAKNFFGLYLAYIVWSRYSQAPKEAT